MSYHSWTVIYIFLFLFSTQIEDGYFMKKNFEQLHSVENEWVSKRTKKKNIKKKNEKEKKIPSYFEDGSFINFGRLRHP